MIKAENIVDYLIQKAGSPFRLRVTGFPACGKTTISKLVRSRISDIVHIESEAWIYSLSFRKSKDYSGSHPDGYDLEAAVRDIRSLLQGKRIFIQNYDHRVGDRTDGSFLEPAIDSPIILDGTPFSLSEFDDLVPTCIFLRPSSLEDWLHASIKRDVEKRYFSEAEATRHNMRKARDMELVLERSPKAQVITCHIPQMMYDITS